MEVQHEHGLLLKYDKFLKIQMSGPLECNKEIPTLL